MKGNSGSGSLNGHKPVEYQLRKLQLWVAIILNPSFFSRAVANFRHGRCERKLEALECAYSAEEMLSESADGKVVLSFHDSLLHSSDVALLQSCGWLNDRLIGFYFE